MANLEPLTPATASTTASPGPSTWRGYTIAAWAAPLTISAFCLGLFIGAENTTQQGNQQVQQGAQGAANGMQQATQGLQQAAVGGNSGSASAGGNNSSSCGATCFNAGPFLANVSQMTLSQQGGWHVIGMDIQFQNTTNQPLIIAYHDGSMVMTDNNGNTYQG